LGFCLSAGERWKEKGSENSNDGDDDEKFDQGESCVVSPGILHEGGWCWIAMDVVIVSNVCAFGRGERNLKFQDLRFQRDRKRRREDGAWDFCGSGHVGGLRCGGAEPEPQDVFVAPAAGVDKLALAQDRNASAAIEPFARFDMAVGKGKGAAAGVAGGGDV
jgi:hypothetical protein